MVVSLRLLVPPFVKVLTILTFMRLARHVSALKMSLQKGKPAPSAQQALSTSASSSSTSNKFELARRLDGLDKPTVWHEFSPLAQKHGAINLGQGFPDWDPPAFVQQAMKQAVDPAFGRHANQYARSMAHMPLAKVLAEDYSERWNMEINPTNQIATAVGCTNVLYCALQGLLNPGDEIILLEPFFDVYSAQAIMAGGKPVYVPLRPTGDPKTETASKVFTLDLAELENAITDKTKVLLLNTPHNPTGKIFSRTELEGIAAIVKKHPGLTVLSDEVYEHLIYDPENEPHISIATIPGMFEQTLTLSSSGKTFSATGFKVGWCVGPPSLVKAVWAVQQWVNFSAPTPNQDAIAQALIQAKEPFEGYNNYYSYLVAEYKRKRSLLSDALTAAGMTPVVPSGGFFIMADTSQIEFPSSYMDQPTEASPNPMPRDWALSRWLTQEVGVTAIPPSAFYSPPEVKLAGNFLRFAFCKGDDTIAEAHRRLETFFK
ncbi:kynurenine--oxoglutarate transaminase 3 [Mayamaea pseudoterrestris]|nr:kynurenine--oxoglutarate transaminase 3 [Mayamaea pseudoterrestris]